MKRGFLKTGQIAIGILFIISIFTTPCFAQDAVKKLGRGLVNILTGWVELPKNIYETSVQSNPLAGITVGLAKGVGMTVVRTGAGVYETATFPFPVPKDYKPVLEPEYVMEEPKKAETSKTAAEPNKK